MTMSSSSSSFSPPAVRSQAPLAQHVGWCASLLLFLASLLCSSSVVLPVRALSSSYSQLSGPCMTIAIADSRPSGLHEVLMACQYLGVIALVPQVSASLIMDTVQCPQFSRTSTMLVSGDLLFVTCSTMGVSSFNLTSRTANIVVQNVEALFGTTALMFDPQSQRLFVVHPTGMMSVPTQGGMRVTPSAATYYVNNTQCNSPLSGAIDGRDVYTTCTGDSTRPLADQWVVWRTHIDTGLTSSVISATACFSALRIHVNDRGLFVLCKDPVANAGLLQHYSAAGALLFTWPTSAGVIPISVWASNTEELVITGSSGGGVQRHDGTAAAVTVISPDVCTSAVDLKVAVSVGTAGQTVLDLAVACINAPLVYSTADGTGSQLLADSCGGTDLLVINPITGITSAHRRGTQRGCREQTAVAHGGVRCACPSVVCMLQLHRLRRSHPCLRSNRSGP